MQLAKYNRHLLRGRFAKNLSDNKQFESIVVTFRIGRRNGCWIAFHSDGIRRG